jgi:hypothetical protein
MLIAGSVAVLSSSKAAMQQFGHMKSSLLIGETPLKSIAESGGLLMNCAWPPVRAPY